ncbi:MAG: MarR family transcriptional regulator [Rhodomicrobiaceae bacterium]
MLTIADVLVFLVQKGPGRTEAELAEAIFADRGYQQRVNQDCNLLVNRGLIERRGEGGANDPYRYYARSNA